MADTFTLSGNVATLSGVPFVVSTSTSQVDVFVVASEPTITDTETKVTRLGTFRAVVAADGSFTATDLPSTADAAYMPDGFLYRIAVRYRDAVTGSERRYESNWFALTADTNFADVVNVALTAIDQATYESLIGARDQAVAAAAAAQAVGTTNDTIIAGRINAPGSATATALTTAFVIKRRTVDVERYRSGTLTDRQILLAAAADLEPGGTLQMGQNVDYALSASTFIDLTSKPNTTIDGRGSRVNGSGFASGYILRFGGGTGPSATTLAGALTSRSDVLTVTSTAGFVAGDMIKVASSGEVWNPDRLTSRKSEYALVKQVFDATTLVLTEPTWDTYALGSNTVTITRIPAAKNLTVADLSCIGADPAGNQTGLQVASFNRAHLERVNASATGIEGIAASGGLDLTIMSAAAEDVRAVGIGYGVHVTDAQHVKVIGSTGHRNRHSFDVDRVRDLLYDGLTATGDSSAGISTHGDTEECKVLNSTVKDCGGGVVTRGKNTRIAHVRIKGTRTTANSPDSYVNGITLGDDGAHTWGVGFAGTGLVITDVDIDLSGPDFSTEKPSAIYCTAALVEARIENVRMRGFAGHGIYAKGDFAAGLQIIRCRVDASAQVGTPGTTQLHGIFVSPAHAVSGNVINDVEVLGNKITGALYDGVRIKGNPTNDGPVSDNIVIRDNPIGACGNRRVNLSDGYYGSRTEVVGNEWLGIALSEEPVLLGANFLAAPYVANNGWGSLGVRTMGVGQEGGARIRPGVYYGPHGLTGVSTPAQDRLFATPIFIPRRVSLDRIGVNVTTAAAGTSVRVGLFADKRDTYGGYPGDLVAGSEQVLDSTSTGFKANGLTGVNVAPGLYWLVAVSQGGTPGLTCLSADTAQTVGYQGTALAAGRTAWVQDAVAGGLPATFSTSLSSQGTPTYVQIRTSN